MILANTTFERGFPTTTQKKKKTKGCQMTEKHKSLKLTERHITIYKV